MDFTRFFAALYISEGRYDYWRMTKKPYAKACGIVLYDRIMAGQFDIDAEILSR